jgi:hydrogenase expression/formation protein HypD
MSLLKARAQGADVRMLYSPLEALILAREYPDKKVVFFAVGFETTTPPTAAMLDAAVNHQANNLYILCNHVLTPPAVKGILEPAKQKGEKVLDGLIGPGHVSVVTGQKLYLELAEDFQVPISITGFEPLDILQSILLLIRQINQNSYQVENQYTRAVSLDGNQKAQNLVNQYFDLKASAEWRGLGHLPLSALKIKDEYQSFDAEKHFDSVLSPSQNPSQDNKACECPSVLIGKKKPNECKLFNNPCTPENPLGSCMVSSEGACSAYFRYKPR